MAKWSPVSITGGCVNTRSSQVLGEGEIVTASAALIKPGDTEQIHRDSGNTTVKDSLADTADIKYINWETNRPQILALNDNVGGGTLALYDAANGSAGTSYSFTGAPDKMAAVHRGNEYFVGNSEQNLVLSEATGSPAFRKMGMIGKSFIGGVSSATITVSTDHATPTNPTNWTSGDLMIYWWTEYDSVNDVESMPVLTTIFVALSDLSPWPPVAWNAGDAPEIYVPWAGSNAKVNSSTDKVRLYRAYLGNNGNYAGTKANDLRDQIVASQSSGFVAALAGRGGLLGEFEWGKAFTTIDKFTDGVDNSDQGQYDPVIPWPLVYINSGSVSAIYPKLITPRAFDTGTVWNDSLVVNDPATSKQILRFSPPGQPEYQPDPYFLYFATDSSDEIVGFKKANGRLIVLLTGSVWRVNYLPFEGFVANVVGKVQENIIDGEGCVNRNCYQVIQGEQGDLVVWLSPLGLRATTGRGWTDICPDWSTDGAGLTNLSNAVLNNNRPLYRLELYVGKQRWDFYYHPSLLKNGKFRMMGPTTMTFEMVASAGGELSGTAASWLAADSVILRQNLITSTNNVEFETGKMRAENPMRFIDVKSVALTHSSLPQATETVVVTTKVTGESSSSETLSLDMTYEETTANDLAGGGMSGNWVKFDMSTGGSGDVSVGPLWIKFETMEDGDG